MHILILQLHTSQLHDDPQPCLPSPWQCWKRSSWRRRSWRRKWRQRPRRLGRGKGRKQSQTACSVPKIEGDVHNSFCANNSCYNCTSIPWGSEFYPDCCCALQYSRLHLLLVCYCPTFLEARDCLHFRRIGSLAAELGFILMIAMFLPDYLLWIIPLTCLYLSLVFVSKTFIIWWIELRSNNHW